MLRINSRTDGAHLERVLQLMEAWGYPRRGADWLRRRRLLAILVLAVLSWCALVGFGFAAYFVAGEIFDVLRDLIEARPRAGLPLASTPR